MKCTDAESLIQQMLDGEPAESLAGLHEHAERCAHCANLQRAALQLVEGLSRTTLPFVRSDVTRHVVESAITARRNVQRRRRIVARAAALAASVLVVFGTASLAPKPVTRSRASVVHVTTEKHKPSIHRQLSEARDTVASLTVGTAESTVAGARSLIPPMPSEMLPEIEFDESIVASTKGIERARARMSSGFEPMADSAQRALNLFLRDLPPLGTPRKPSL